MKPSKPVLDRSHGYDLKIVLPRMNNETMSKSQPKPPFKRKKPRHERISGSSDKENDTSGSVVYPQPKLNLIHVDKMLTLDQRDELVELSPADRKLVGTLYKRGTRTTEYSKVGSCRIENSDTYNETVRHSESTATSSNANDVDVDVSTSKHQKKKAKKDKCYRKDSGIGMDSPKAKRTKRKLSDHLDYQSDDVQKTASIIHPSENEIRGLEDIIQSHSSHTCSDKVDHEINNVETIRTSMGLYVYRDFAIRISQVCTDQPSEEEIPACTTSVVASTTRCEDIEKSAKKERRNVAVEKKIGINTRVKVGDREKNCTRIVESKLVETTEQRHKKIKLDEPSGMVTRRKAAVNLEYKFYTLTNQKNCGLVENHNISNKQSGQQNQNQENGANQNKKSKPSKKELSKERKPKTTNKKNKANESKSFHSSNEGETTNAEKFENAATNFKQKTGSTKILKDVTLCRLENSELWPRRTIQLIEQSIPKKTSRAPKGRPKKISNLDQAANKPDQEVDVAGTKKLRNYSKTKKRLDDEENAIDNETNAKQSDSRSSAKVPSKVSLPKGKKQDSKSSTKLKNHKSTSAVGVISPLPGCSGILLPKGKKQDVKSSARLRDRSDDEVELPKKHPKLPAKKLMKKNEALEKTERFNEKKKVLMNGDMTVSSKTVTILLEDFALLEDVPLSRRITKSSSKTQNTSSVANTSKVETARGTPAVTFPSKTPKTIPRRVNDNGNDWNQNYTPCILLDRLDVRDISTYAITPLREDRRPLAPKSAEDYGIDDVNTDDSTDEEDCPKKRVPNWVNSVGHNSKVQFYFPRDVILTWIRPPKKKFTVANLFT